MTQTTEDSPVRIGFFLIPALATLRFQLRLVWFATIAAMLGYVWLLGWAVWIQGVRDIRVPRYHELIFLTALAMSVCAAVASACLPTTASVESICGWCVATHAHPPMPGRRPARATIAPTGRRTTIKSFMF